MKEHKLAAIVFTDIVGYTRRMEADEEGTMKLLARQREIIFPVVKEYGGEVIKEIGDGLMMMFTSANRAVRFAMAIQDKLKDEELTIRAGIHIGDVIFEEGDVFGSAVNIAARIEPLAPAGGICISEDVRSQIRNQKDILTQSIGRKELKGVDESLEIFTIVSELTAEERSRVPFFKDLWQRRVLQITVIYLILAYVVRLGIGFLVKEYMLSPHLINLIWYILLSLIPSIALVSYFHGKRGVSRWTRVELIGLPLNFLAAFLVLFFVFKEKDLGAMTTRLTVQNEDGLEVEKIVLKSEFRKSIYLFNFKTESEDSSMVYLQYSLPSVLEYDLAQDLFISPQPALDNFQDIVEAGYPTGLDLPVTLMKRLAEENHKNYFLTGELEREGEELIIKARLYDTKLTKQISEFTIKSPDPFSLTDLISIEVKKGMGLPESHISATVDLPIAEIFTGSEKALYFFSKSMRAKLERSWDEHVFYMNKAIEEDPEFAMAHLIISISYFNNNDPETAKAMLETARKLEHKLPERLQFTLKYVYYVLNEQPEKALAVVKMWVELFPYDISAHITLAERYTYRNMFDEAIATYKTIIRLDPERYNIVQNIAELYFQKGDFDSSLVYYQNYAKALPQQAESYTNLGDYYSMLGDLEKARENFEKALLLATATEEHAIKVDLATIQMHSGEFEKSYEGLLDALVSAKNNIDSIRAYNALQNYYLILGQAQNSLDCYKRRMEIFYRILPPQRYMVNAVFTIEPYIIAGKLDEARMILDDVYSKLEPPINKIVPFGYLFIYAETGDTLKAREAISEAEEIIHSYGEEMLRGNILYAQAKINELIGDYASAISNYEEGLDMNATRLSFFRAISRCYRKMGDYSKAEEMIQKVLTLRPYNPSNNYEAALLYLEKGEKDKGLEFLRKAVSIWENADVDYEEARLAKEKLAAFN